MAETNTEQKQAIGHLTIKRLRKGRNIILGFVSDKALFQAWNPVTKQAEPQFDASENVGPTVTPTVYTSDGGDSTEGSGTGVKVTMNSDSKWYYNSLSNPIEWNEESGGYRTSKNGLFKENIKTHALTFIGNIASDTNRGTDTFYFRAAGEAGGVNYEALGSFEFKIQEISDSGWVLMTSGGNLLTSDITSTKLTAYLYCNGKPVTTGYIEWRTVEDDVEKSLITTGYTATITAVHVFGQGPDSGVRVYAWPNEASKNAKEEAVAYTFHQINDLTDAYDVESFIISDVKEWDGTNSVWVGARLRNIKTQAVVDNKTLSKLSWNADIYDSRKPAPVIKDMVPSSYKINNVTYSPAWELGITQWAKIDEDCDMTVALEALW